MGWILETFIGGLKQLEGYKGQIEHIESLPAKRAVYGTLDDPLPPPLQQYLDNREIRLYKHQADAINLVRKGENVVISTPTASGKTIAFNLLLMGLFAMFYLCSQ